MAGIVNVQRTMLKRFLPMIRRQVSTSNKKCDTVTAESIKTESKSVTQKSWVTYGFEYKSKEADRNAFHSIMFMSVTLCLVFGGTYWAYLPDHGLKDWSQREAYIELRRREQNGLLPIDPNFINPANIELPSDEELGDTEIVI